MCFQFLAVGMLIFGFITLMTGKFGLDKSCVVRGVHARVIGVILMLPLPLTFAASGVAAVVSAAQGREADSLDMEKLGTIEARIILVCLLVAVIAGFVLSGAPPTMESGGREDDESSEGQ